MIEVVPDASTDTYDLVPDISINFAGGIRNADQAKWNPKRTVIRFNYRHRRAYNNTDGAFSVSPSGSLDDQWAAGRRRHPPSHARVGFDAGVRNLNAQMSWDANSGSPYTITTGTDDNGDSIFNDRPLATPRNSVRLPWRSTLLRERVVHDSDRQGARARGRASRRGRTARPRRPAVVRARGVRRASRSACRRRT